MAVEREMSPQGRGATIQGLNGKEIPAEAAEKILGVLDSTIDQFLAAKQAQRLEKDLPTRVLEDGTKEWRNEAGLFHREKGPAIEFSDGRLLYFQNGALHRSDGPAVINTDGSRLYFLNDKQVQEREIIPARIRENGVKEWHNEKGELHREHGPAFTHPDGTEGWHRNGVMHREGGPAFTDGVLGEQKWYREGNLHREDGPAIERDTGEKEYYQHGKLHREDGPAIERPDGTQEWYKHGQLHCEQGPAIFIPNGDGREGYYYNGQPISWREIESCPRENGGEEWSDSKGKPHRTIGPAIIQSDGTKEWHQHGKLHRVGGPAIEYADNSKEYYQNGQLHREDGPARVEITDNVAVSYAEYRIRGELHREDGPAIERDTGEKEYYRHGKLHREDGPAVERPDGTKEYYLNGEKGTAAELVNKLGFKTINATPLTEKRAEILLSMAEEARRDAGRLQEPATIQTRLNDPIKPGISTERIQQANTFMDRPLPQGKGVARDYCEAAREIIRQEGRWPGQPADEKIAKNLLQKGHDKCRVIGAIQGKSPEILDRNSSESRAYAKALVDRALTPEVKKERQRGVSRDR